MGTRKHFVFSRTGRSREGAWIEIISRLPDSILLPSRSREGAWIEIRARQRARFMRSVAPARERGLK